MRSPSSRPDLHLDRLETAARVAGKHDQRSRAGADHRLGRHEEGRLRYAGKVDGGEHARA